jgi:AraC-like DNA-binding protein
MMEEAIVSKNNHEHICENLLGTFLMMLEREINAGHYLLPGPRVTHETPGALGTNFLIELNDYVLAHLNEPLTLESVARQMHSSRAQFARNIRQQTGQTFIAYLTQRRLEEAQILLRESEWTSIAISEFVGFKSSTYFHRLFREKIGMTPGDFRLKSRKTMRSRKKIQIESQ